jgi:hypothetical protein
VEEAAEAEKQLAEEYGRVRDFVPPASVQPSTERLEVFLAVRGEFSEARVALEEAVLGLASVNEDGGVSGGLRAARAGISMPQSIMEFSSARNRALIDAGMGRGEYTWIYWLTYFAWLGHPADDSELHETLNDMSHEHGRVNVQIDGGMEPERMTWRLRRDVMAMLKNLQDELDSDGSPIRELIVEELEKLSADPARVPWEDGLPEEVAIGLEPFRDRLEASYSRATNPFELIDFD